MTRKNENAARAGELLNEAIDGALAVLRDKEAPATSKASAVGSAIRLYEMLVGDGGPDKEPSEMTFDEIQAKIERLNRSEEAGQ